MGIKLRVLVVFVLLLTSLAIIANLPGPTPSAQTISNLEGNADFKAAIGSANYTYFGYSVDPSYSTRCVGIVFGNVFHFFSPFRQYTTTSLMFFLQQSSSEAIPYLLFVRVNPSTGHIYNIQKEEECS